MELGARKILGGAAVVLASLSCGCGSIQVEAGAPFDPAKLETTLRPGVSTQRDVRELLGEPHGKGGALLPFHDAPRSTWTYFHERGTIDMGKGELQDQRMFLFVFFAGEKFDGYMWFPSALTTVKK